MSIIGGAVFPAVMGYISDMSNIRIAFLVALCLPCLRALFRCPWLSSDTGCRFRAGAPECVALVGEQ